MIEAIVDSRCRFLYASYYIQGLLDNCKKVSYSARRFKSFKFGKEEYEAGMALILKNTTTGEEVKVVIDFHDSTKLSVSYYEWCDIYAKVNLNETSLKTQKLQKVVPFAPGFSINIFKSKTKAILQGIRNYFYSCGSEMVTFKAFMNGYISRKRIMLDEYSQFNIKTSDDYIFFVSTLWHHQSCVEYTNVWRSKFIRICRENPSIKFEGGFVSNITNSEYEKYKDLIIPSKFTLQQYISKLSQSVFTFNTPAVHLCHGWKFAEFMMMGKAIISTPIVNELPSPVIHGEHVHIVNSEAELKEAVELLMVDVEYRKRLGKGALNYYENHLKPECAIQFLIKKLEWA